MIYDFIIMNVCYTINVIDIHTSIINNQMVIMLYKLFSYYENNVQLYSLVFYNILYFYTRGPGPLIKFVMSEQNIISRPFYINLQSNLTLKSHFKLGL